VRANLFWLNDQQWAKIEPLIPMNSPGPKPRNNRRILTGIPHVLKSGCRWQDRPRGMAICDGVQSLQSLERTWNLATDLREGRRRTGTARPGGAGQHACQCTPLRWWRKRGAAEQAIGVTRGGRNSKAHALADKFCRPWVIILTPGNVADCTVGSERVTLMAGSIKRLLGDKAYDSNSFRNSLRSDGITPVIPGRANRKKRIRQTREPTRGATSSSVAIADSKILGASPATRYDKLAKDFFPSVCLVGSPVLLDVIELSLDPSGFVCASHRPSRCCCPLRTCSSRI
jgi:transposase